MRRSLRTLTAVLAFGLLAACGTPVPAGDDPNRPVSDSDSTAGPSGPLGSLTVVVVDSEGAPVAGAQVLPASVDDPDRRFGQRNRVTDDSGEYTLRLEPGEYAITVTSGSVTSEPQEAVVTEDETTVLEVELAL